MHCLTPNYPWDSHIRLIAPSELFTNTSCPHCNKKWVPNLTLSPPKLQSSPKRSSSPPTSTIKRRHVLLNHQGQFNDHSSVQLPHVKQTAAMMCLLVWVLLHLTPQLSTMVHSHIFTSNMFGSAALLRYATTASRLNPVAQFRGVLWWKTNVCLIHMLISNILHLQCQVSLVYSLMWNWPNEGDPNCCQQQWNVNSQHTPYN